MRVCQFRHFGMYKKVQRETLNQQQFLLLQRLRRLSNVQRLRGTAAFAPES